jgi:hypothetical protein
VDIDDGDTLLMTLNLSQALNDVASAGLLIHPNKGWLSTPPRALSASNPLQPSK